MKNVAELDNNCYLLQDLSDAFGEMKNRQSYLNGSMGPVTDEIRTSVENRLNNVLMRAQQKHGLNADKLLEIALADAIPKLEWQKLIQVIVILEFRRRMWRKGQNLQHEVACYRDARRMLRKRYYLVKRDMIPTLLPTGYDLNKVI